eukprot:1651691-Pyramimonas_sp.AAC.2
MQPGRRVSPRARPLQELGQRLAPRLVALARPRNVAQAVCRELNAHALPSCGSLQEGRRALLQQGPRHGGRDQLPQVKRKLGIAANAAEKR